MNRVDNERKDVHFSKSTKRIVCVSCLLKIKSQESVLHVVFMIVTDYS